MTLKTDTDFIGFFVELMNKARLLLMISASLIPDEETGKRGFKKHPAIVLGHMIRLYKLFDAFTLHISRKELEIALIFSRPIYETEVKIHYLIGAKASSFKSYIITSYRAEKENLSDLEAKSKSRKLIPIEKRIRDKIKRRLREDRISLKELRHNRNWILDGKDFRSILRSLNRDAHYSYTFGSASQIMHGGWYDISIHHLKKHGRYYHPKLDYTDPDPRTAGPITALCLMCLLQYIPWSKGDPDGFLTGVVKKLLDLTMEVDKAHGMLLSTR